MEKVCEREEGKRTLRVQVPQAPERNPRAPDRKSAISTMTSSPPWSALRPNQMRVSWYVAVVLRLITS